MARYIDVDPILKDMCSHRQHSVPFEYLKSLTPARVVPTPRWISVKERLPEAGEDVLVYLGGGKIDVCWLIHNMFWGASGALYDLDDVSHWMPLPEPPKEVE